MTLPPSGSGSRRSRVPTRRQVFAHHETFILVGELAFVNDEADLGHAAFHAEKI